MELLKSRDMLEKVVLACDLQQQDHSAWSRALAAIGVHSSARTPEGGPPIATAVRTLETKLGVQVVNKTNLIAVNYKSPDPELAARVLTALTNSYLEKHLAVHRPPGTFDFFQQETQQYRKELAEAEAASSIYQWCRRGFAKLEKEVALQKLAEFDATLKQTQASARRRSSASAPFRAKLRLAPLA